MWEFSSIRNKKGFYYGMTDFIFKNALFEKNEELTKWFLEKMLSCKIESVILKKTELPKKTKEGKTQNLDIVVVVNSTLLLDIEVNTSFYKSLPRRNLGYAMNLYNKYIVNDRINTDIKELKLINLIVGLSNRYSHIKNKSSIQTIYREQYVQDFEILTFNIDKVKNYWYSWDEAMIRKYSYLIMLFLGEEDLLKLCKLKCINPKDRKNLNEFRKEVIEMNKSVDYEMWKERYHIYKWGLEQEKKELAEEATKKGMKQGIVQNKISNARKMLLDNVSPNLVRKYTDLPLAKVRELQKSLDIAVN